jgi:phosphohistidine swiveling domain-containing protein
VSEPLLLPLSNALDVEECGNKAFNLGRAMRAGLGSQEGFVIEARVFQSHLSRLGLHGQVTALLRPGSEAGDEAESLRGAIRQGGLSDDLSDAISSVLVAGETYAVRSSAVGEDGTSTSFAGQFDSVLGCTTPEEVADAVRAVWASLLNQRALAYASRNVVPLSRMAVIVQRQVAAVASGVLFTRDPRSPEAQHMIVEYCDGLGEKLVSGSVTPASGLIDRGSGDYAGERDAESVSTWTPLANSAAMQLRDLGLALEREFGCPQDIEFSVDQSGQIVLLQARPITILPARGPMVSWSNANIAENFPDPVCRMLQSFVALGYGAYFRSLAAAFGVPAARLERMDDRFDEIVACHGGRLYYNLSNIHALLYTVPGGRKLAEYFNTFTGAEGLEPPADARSTTLRELIALAQMPFRILSSYLGLSRRLKSFEALIDAYARDSHRRTLDAKSSEDLARLIEGFLDIRLNSWTPAALSDAAAMISYGLLGTLLRGKPDIDANALLQGLPGLASAAPVEALWTLASELKNDPAAEIIRSQAPDDVLVQLQDGALGEAGRKISDYLDVWGFRSSGELLLVRPTPQEDPISVLHLLRAYLQSEDVGPIAKSLRQAEVRKQRTLAAALALRPGRRQLFRMVLWATQKSIGLRERARMKQALLYSRLRQVALAAGRHLVQNGTLSRADDIFHLGLGEVVDVLRGSVLPAGTVAERKQLLEDNKTWAPPAAFVLPQGQMFSKRDRQDAPVVSGDADCLRGIPACAGRTTGTAAVVLDVSEIGTIQKDQILVTQQTDPGWAAVFFLVKGLVIERGGLLSHGAIIAREYGIPAVIGVKEATKLIRNGAQIEILADLGEVRVHAE